MLGIAAGIWLGDLFKGLGSGNGIGIGQSGITQVSVDQPAGTVELGMEGESNPTEAPETVRVVIRDRGFFLKSGDEETPIELGELITLIQSAQGDEDGIKLRVYRSASARVTTELALRDALKAAEIADAAIHTPQDVVE